MTREQYLELRETCTRRRVEVLNTLSRDHYRLVEQYLAARDADSAGFMSLAQDDQLTILSEEREERERILRNHDAWLATRAALKSQR